jgi:von Willebrand factor type A domain/Domain of unknown function DUF11
LSNILIRLLPLILLGQILSGSVFAQQRDRLPNLNLGDAVVTAFSGTIAPDPAKPRPANKSAVDLTFINSDGPSARIVDVSRPGYVWDGRLFTAPKTFDVFAKDVGQVFGVALDDQQQPNIYVASTSVFGLNIVNRGHEGSPERRKKGGPGTGWMKGQFGLDLQGGPGSIYKVDGRTGVVTLFANVTLNGVPNPAPGLGNLAYDSAHKQLFVSDLHTGMIHRFDLDGKELSAFDHGVTGLTAAKLPTVPFNPANRPNIATDRFDSEKPDTWGFAPAARRIWGLAVHQDRLYYSVMSGPQIWSVGIARDGSFANDPRWELDVPAQAGPLPVSDIAFSNKGAMILAQRALIAGAYDYSAFTQPGEPKVFRVWLKGPNDPPSPGRWKLVPEEYAVGFAGNYRNTNGGVALGYGYGRDGTVANNACEFSLWTTAQNIRNAPPLKTQLDPGGPLVVHGLTGLPSSPVRDVNTPPWLSYNVDYDDTFEDPRAAGHMGSVRIYSQPCPATAIYGGPGYASNPPYINGGGGSGPDCVGANCNPDRPIDVAIKKRGATTPAPQVGAYSFTLDVTNVGAPFNGTNIIKVTDTVPPGMTFNTATGTNWTCATLPASAGTTITCTYTGTGPTSSGQSLGTITIGATATGSAPFPPFKNCAQVGVPSTSGLKDTDPSNNEDCVTVTKPKPPIDVAIEKSGTATPGPVNTALSYSLKVTNILGAFSGNGAIVVSDPAPAGVTYTGVSWTALGDWACTFTASNIDCHYTGSGPATPGQVLGTITVTGTASGDGPWTNCATVAVDQGAGTDGNADNNKSCVTLKNDGFIPRDPPPPYNPSCGMNVLFVVDESHSIADANATYNVTSALTAAASALNNNGAQTALVRFSDNALVVQPWSTGAWGSLNTGYNPATGGGTNWEAAMLAAKSLLPKPNSIIIFITDGVPTAYLDNGGAVQYTSNSVQATNEAIPIVNQIYGLGTPIIGIGIGSFATHLNALLGGNVSSTSYGGLGGTLTSIAQTLCPQLYLTKQISPNYINYFYSPAPQQVTVTLKLTNTTSAAVNAEVQDALPPELTSPNTFNASLGSASGNPVNWTIPGLASGATATLTFKATVSPSTPPPTNSWTCYKNFSQVTKVNGVAQDSTHLMANAVTGPVHESDEASDQVCVQNHENVQQDCGNSYLTVLKKTAFPEICSPGGSPACTFNITVTARCKAFNGPVLFGDGVFSGTTVVNPTITSITNTASPPICPWSSGWSGTTAPSSCSANISLPVNTSITFTVTLAGPLPPLPAGQKYTNCFVADGKTPVPTTFPAAYTDVHPTSDPNGGVWGNCTPFNVQSQPQGIMACPEGTTRQVKNGTSACLPTPSACVLPMVAGPVAGQCLCPQGTVLRGKECVKTPTCQPPMVVGPVAGQCICPQGMTKKGSRCVEQVVCRQPAKLNSRGTACVCPTNMVAKGNSCVERDRITPKDVMRGFDGLRGLGGGGGGRTPDGAGKGGGQGGGRP